jgi:hypothetical protein
VTAAPGDQGRAGGPRAAYDARMASASRDELIALALRLIEAGERAGVPLRAMGGAGVGLRAPGAPRRELADIDLAAPRRARRDVEDLMRAAGLEPEREFNALHGGSRQIWWIGEDHVDVFLGEFRMCHRLDLAPALTQPGPALPAADLLLTKLQVVELNAKDVHDAVALLSTHELAEAPGALSVARLREVLVSDWGFYTTATDNLERLPEHAPAVADACAAIRQELESAPKGTAFRMRARVGRRKRWYELPEETAGT